MRDRGREEGGKVCRERWGKGEGGKKQPRETFRKKGRKMVSVGWYEKKNVYDFMGLDHKRYQD